MSGITELMVRISADVKQFEQGMAGFQKKIYGVRDTVATAGKSLSKNFTVPVLAAAGAVVGLMTKYGAYADELLDASAITGLSTDEMQKWRKMAVDAGVDVDIVTKSVQTFNKQLERGNELSPRLAKGFDTMNISVEDFKKLEPDEQMRKIIGTMTELEEADARAFANQMGMPDLLPIIGDLVADGRDLDQIMAEIDIPFSTEDLEQMNEFRKEWDNLKESLSLLMGQALQPLFKLFSENREAIQGKLMPAVENLVQMVISLFEWFAELNPETQKMIGMAVGLAVALGPVLGVIALLITAIGAIISPIGLVVVAVIALVAAAIYLWKNWDEIITWLNNLWDTFVNWILERTEKLRERMHENIDKIKQFFETGFSDMVQTAKNKVEEIKQAIIQRFIEIVASVGMKIIELYTNVRNRFTQMQTSIRQTMENIKTAAINAWTALKTGVVTKAQELYTEARAKLEQTWNYIKGLPAQAVQWGKDIIQGLINGIKNMAGNLGGAIKGVAENAVNAAKSFLGIRSPSKVFEGIGLNMGEGMSIGLGNAQRMIGQSIEKMSMGGMNLAVSGATSGGATSGGTLSVRHEIDLRNTPEGLNTHELKSFLFNMFNDPGYQREIDRAVYKSSASRNRPGGVR
ncbi:phage tail protein [Candidatus Contubernalis alkaliaceticus]|uniref:phage tail protein n=1 Tax=Candidatus Contubernalis alkaliaceticus TaxID=338645 RepID=UPI001F4C2F72|nr:hypothetical protein [Candidatus Contubernalis alkalaceticus]UNC92408.1 hypothetical protein HUE98_10035 [Candidatus Contubernalis alkalaceticus]